LEKVCVPAGDVEACRLEPQIRLNQLGEAPQFERETVADIDGTVRRLVVRLVQRGESVQRVERVTAASASMTSADLQ
jgi:hypothetical protein